MSVAQPITKLAKRKYHVVLVSPQIPHNTGSIGRTCLAFGARLHLIGPYGFKLDDKSVKRAGLDYWPFVDLHEYKNWNDFEEGPWKYLGKNSFFFTKFGTTSLLDINFVPSHEVSSAMMKLRKDYIQGLNTNSNIISSKKDQEEQDEDDITLLFGSETCGLHKLIGAPFVNSQNTIYMPMLNTQHRENDTPSFNLAASVAMGLWEAYRQDAKQSGPL